MNEMVPDLARLTNVKFTMLFFRCIVTATIYRDYFLSATAMRYTTFVGYSYFVLKGSLLFIYYL